MKLHLATLLVATTILTACGGGGGSTGGAFPPSVQPHSALPSPTPSATAKAAPAPAPVASIPPSVAARTTNVVVTIDDGGDTTAQAISRRIQTRGRSAQYVSPSSLGIQVSASGYTTQAFDVSAGSPLCTGSGAGRTCTLGVNVKPGSYTFTMGLYDKKPVGGVISSANLLGISTLSKTIVANATNSLAFFISGEIHTLSNSTSYGSLPADGTARGIVVMFLAQDYGNNTIATTGSTPYANPVTVSLSEAGGSGHSYITINGTAVGSSGVITQASDVVRIIYDGNGAPGYTSLYSFAASTAFGSSYRMSPLYVSGSASPASASASATVTITEANAPGGVGYAQSLSGNCAGQATSSGGGTGASGSATVTDAQLPPVGVACTLTISDNLGSAIAVPVNIPPGTPVCSSYPNGRQLSPQDYSNGSLCGLAISPTSLSIKASGGSPNTATFNVSENNTQNAISVSSSCSSGSVSLSPSSVASGGALANTFGTITVTGGLAGACTVTVSDGNGQSGAVSVAIAANCVRNCPGEYFIEGSNFTGSDGVGGTYKFDIYLSNLGNAYYSATTGVPAAFYNAFQTRGGCTIVANGTTPFSQTTAAQVKSDATTQGAITQFTGDANTADSNGQANGAGPGVGSDRYCP